MARRYSLLLLVWLLQGCSSPIPPAIREAPATAPSLAQVQAHPADYQGQTVRWGGVIDTTRNLADSTELTIIAYPLSGNGYPLADESTQGRFLAHLPGFLEPNDYRSGRKLTVAGTVIDVESGTVGEFNYDYPRVQVNTHYLWPELPEMVVVPPYRSYRDPWWPYYNHRYPWGDPFYDPYYWRYRPYGVPYYLLPKEKK